MKFPAAADISLPIFQLEEAGSVLPRATKSKAFSHPDVPFIPDEWQFDLLKSIDRSKSCLVVVPTSAGKSYVSFYTITNVLQWIRSPEGVRL